MAARAVTASEFVMWSTLIILSATAVALGLLLAAELGAMP